MRRVVVWVLASITLTTLAYPALAINKGTVASTAPNVVHIVQELSDGRKMGVCSGALLAPRIVVTAAHCVNDSDTGLLAKNIWVSPPGTKFKINSDGYKVLEDGGTIVGGAYAKAISTQVTSSYYSSSDIVEDNDVAFLVLDRSYTVATNIVLASDEETEKFITDNTTVRLYGYGQTSFDGDASLVPMTTTMILDFKSTDVKNSAYLTSTTTDSCPGDSGGPVIVSTPTKLYLVGIISGGLHATSGPECSRKYNGYYYTLITLITKYANLAFAAAVSAERESTAARIKAEADATTALAAKTKAETEAAAALGAQTKAEAAAKEALALKVKAESDAKSASDAMIRAEIDARSSETLRLQAETVANAAVSARNDAESSLAKVKTELSSLQQELALLKGNLSALTTENASLKKKLTTICKIKPKPKGC